MIAPADIRRGKILIVDDKEVNVLLLERALRGDGYESVSSTTDSREVCALHRENGYDLILLDLEMPKMDGFTVLADLKKAEADGFPAVLAVTAHPAHRLRALQSGAEDFLSKPFDLAEVMMRVRNLLEVRLLRATAEGAASRSPGTEGRVVRFELTPRMLVWLIASLAGLWLLYRLWMILLLMVIALVFVGTFQPVIAYLEARGHKRMNALALLMLGMGLGAAALAFLMVPALIDQTGRIMQDLPAQRDVLIALLGRHHLTAPLGRGLSAIGIDQASSRLQTYLIGYSSDAVRVAGYAVTTFFLALYLLADGKHMQGALYSLVPRGYHMRLARIVHKLEKIVGGYMRGQIITSIVLSSFTFLLLTACRVNNALSLALLASLLDVIPFGGGLLATVPAALTALSRGPGTAAVVLAAMCAYQIFEDKVLAPRIYWHTLRLSPAAVVLALIAGGTLLGMIGALLALPIAAGLQMIIEELGVSLPGDDSDDPEARARDLKTEAAYELMSSGATPHDAGQIAAGLAHDIRDADAWVKTRRERNEGP